MKTNDDWGKSTGPHARYPLPAAMNFLHPFYHRFDDHIRFFRKETNRQELAGYQGLIPRGRHVCTALLSKIVGKQNSEFDRCNRILDNLGQRQTE